MNRETLKKFVPHISAILIFIIINTIYFNPQLKGYKLKQHDAEQYLGMSREVFDFREKFYSEPLWTNSAFSGMPAYQISKKDFNLVNSIKNTILSILPSTTARMFSLMIGFYILLLCFNVNPWTAVLGSIAFGLSSFNLLYLAAGHIAKIQALAFVPPLLGSIIYAYRKNYLIGGVLLSIFVCLQLAANHLQITYYMLFMLLATVLFELYSHLKRKELLKFTKISTVLLIAGILGALPTMSNLIVTYEYSKYTTRGKSELTISADNTENTNNDALESEYIKRYSLGKGEVWSLVFPNVKGGAMGYIGNEKDIMRKVKPAYRENIAQQSSYWGEQYASGGAFYFGSSIFLLCILGMFFIKDRIKWAFFVVSILSIILSLKYSSITDLFIQHFPLFNKFRDTKMMLALVQVTFPLLGVLFVNSLFKEQIDKKRFLYISLSVSGLFLLFYIMPSTWFNFLSKAEVQQFNSLSSNYNNNPNALRQIDELKNELIQARIAIFKKDGIRSLFFIIITSIIIYLFITNKLKEKALLISLGVIIILDFWGVDKRYLNNQKQGSKYLYWVKNDAYDNPYRADVADNTILKLEMEENATLKNKLNEFASTEKDNLKREKTLFRELRFATNYRVLNLNNPFSNSRTAYFHKSLGGYHGAKLKKYQELIEFGLSKELNAILSMLRNTPTQDKIDSLLKNNTPVLNMLNTKYIIYNNSSVPIVNSYFYGNAWFIKNTKIVENADEEILLLPYVDKNTAIIGKNYANKIPDNFVYDPAGEIELLSYKSNHLVYESKTQSDQVAVFSEIYYPAGWNVYIDEKKSDYFHANYILRAMIIPSGEHTIEFKFEPESYQLGKKISYAGSGLIFVFIAGLIFLNVRRNRN